MMNRQTLLTRIVRWLLLALILFVLGMAGLKVLCPFPYREAINRWTGEYSTDQFLVAAVIRAESHFRTHATSSAGAIGLMQIMPTTGEWIAGKIGMDGFTVDDLYDSETNIRLGVWYMRYLIDRFGDIDTALAAYNAGPSNVRRWHDTEEEAFAETTEFVRKVRKGEREYRFLYTLPILGPLLRAIAL
ncbi:MAG TPA: lytic transglycosylase domain-containing protein [Candidatus Acetothermia bacterium]|nr:lytic transglycosylase domain-containing protein [Candidatus Acetothermia bacterium]